MTRSPLRQPLTPAPTSFTVPASSLPGENGSGGLNWYLFWIISTSGKFRLAALTLTTTSPAPATGEGRSSITSDSGGPNCLQRTAFIGVPCAFSRRADYDRTGAAPLLVFAVRGKGPRNAWLQGRDLEIRAHSPGPAEARRGRTHWRLPQDAHPSDRRRYLLRHRSYCAGAGTPAAFSAAVCQSRHARSAGVRALR